MGAGRGHAPPGIGTLARAESQAPRPAYTAALSAAGACAAAQSNHSCSGPWSCWYVGTFMYVPAQGAECPRRSRDTISRCTSAYGPLSARTLPVFTRARAVFGGAVARPQMKLWHFERCSAGVHCHHWSCRPRERLTPSIIQGVKRSPGAKVGARVAVLTPRRWECSGADLQSSLSRVHCSSVGRCSAPGQRSTALYQQVHCTLRIGALLKCARNTHVQCSPEREQCARALPLGHLA